MFRKFWGGVTLAAFLFLTNTSMSQEQARPPPCMSLKNWEEGLKAAYDEHRIRTYRNEEDGAVLFLDPVDRSWTVVVRKQAPDTWCILAAGKGIPLKDA